MVALPKKLCTLIYIGFISSISVGPDEVPHDAAFYLGLHCLPKYLEMKRVQN